jgi:hypothetical protein
VRGAGAGETAITPALELGIDSFIQSFEITDQLLGDLDRVDVVRSRALRDTSEVFTEIRALAELGLSYEGPHAKLGGRSYLSLGSDLWREGAALNLRVEDGARTQRFDLRGEFEARQFREGSDFALGSDLTEARFRSGWRHRVAESLSLGVRGRVEWLDYAERSEFELDRGRFETSTTARVERGFDFFWDLEAGAGHSAVPDSTEIAFDRGFLISDLSARVADRLRLGAYAVVDRRVYGDAAVRSATWNFLFEPELVWQTSRGGRIRAFVSCEWLDHDTATDVYFDLLYGRTGVLFEMVRGAWTLGAEPRWSWLDSPDDVEDRYVQPSIALKLDFFGAGRFWLSLSEELGRRDYVTVADPDLQLYSDYFFLRSTLLLSYELHPRVRIDGFLSDEPESHQLVEDDSRLTLLNLSIRCSL